MSVSYCRFYCLFFFFFQAEDGIRDLTVTGVQTCALPILFINLSGQPYASLAAAKAAGAPVVAIGVFLNSVFDFLIVAFVIFLLIRQVNRMKRQTEVPAVAPITRDCPFCWSSIPMKATRCPHCTSELKAA